MLPILRLGRPPCGFHLLDHSLHADRLLYLLYRYGQRVTPVGKFGRGPRHVRPFVDRESVFHRDEDDAGPPMRHLSVCGDRYIKRSRLIWKVRHVDELFAQVM